MSRSTNRRCSLTEPEIWFKIVHITPELRDVRPEATDHDQTVEIALGPKGDLREWPHRHPDAPRARRPGRERRPATSDHANTAKGSQDTPNRRTPAQGHRVAGSPGVRRGYQPGRGRPQRRPHPGPGDPSHGSAAPRTRDPAAHSGHARHGPQALDHRARPTACDPAGTTGSTASGLPTTGRPALSLACKPTSTKSQRSRRRGERDALVLVTRCSRVSWFSRSGVYGQPVTFRHTVLTVMRRAKAVKSAGFRVYSGSACARAVAPMSRSAKRRRLGRPLPFSVA